VTPATDARYRGAIEIFSRGARQKKGRAQIERAEILANH
jgi:hypothetical protein